MKRILGLGLSAAVIGALGVALAADDEVRKSYDFTGFDKIWVSGVYDIEVTVGSGFSIELSGPADEMARAEVKKRGDKLDLGQRKRGKKRHRREGVEATITLPSLEALEVSGVVDGVIEGVDSERLTVDLSGVGDVDVSGRCGELDALVSGVGELDASDLECRHVTVRVSGVGEAEVYASESVDAVVSGMGDITVYGSPKKVKKHGGLFSDITIR
ncbi:MAG: head GIN domain-containing protein [Parvularculaceae bacterium]